MHGGDAKDYAVYLFAGMVPWGFFSGSLSDCAFCIITNEGLIRKIYLPKLIFPLTRVLINLMTFVPVDGGDVPAARARWGRGSRWADAAAAGGRPCCSPRSRSAWA